MITSLDRARLVLLVLLAAVLGVGLWAYRGVGESLRDIRASELDTLLDNQIDALRDDLAQGWRGGTAGDLLPARPGKSGHLFVFDGDGRLLTDSRDAEPPAPRARAPRLVRPDTDTPTRLALEAAAARSAGASHRVLLLDPYPNHLDR